MTLAVQDVLDVELCTYALTLVNKTLYEIDDQPTFYDQADFMEDLGIDRWQHLGRWGLCQPVSASGLSLEQWR